MPCVSAFRCLCSVKLDTRGVIFPHEKAQKTEFVTTAVRFVSSGVEENCCHHHATNSSWLSTCSERLHDHLSVLCISMECRLKRDGEIGSSDDTQTKKVVLLRLHIYFELVLLDNSPVQQKSSTFLPRKKASFDTNMHLPRTRLGKCAP